MALTPWLSHFKTDFELARRRRQESIAFDALRCEAFDRFLLLGCPTQADEHWRYVDISPIAERNFTLGAAPSESTSPDQVAPFVLNEISGIELTFVNGFFAPQLSNLDRLKDGLVAAPLKAALGPDAGGRASLFAQIAPADCLPMVALNTALFEDGACVIVPPDTTIDRPIHVRFICNGEADAKPAMTQPRALIVVGDRGAARVIESYAGAQDVEYFTNAVTEIVLGEGARLEHDRVQRESDVAYHLSASHLIAGPHSMYSAQCVNGGGTLARSETMATLAGSDARCHVHATTVAAGHVSVNVHTSIDHAATGCVSRHRYGWSLGEHALGVASGRTTVRPDALDSHVRYANRAVLLSPNARIEIKPTFDLLANDVAFAQSSRVRRSNDAGAHLEDILRKMSRTAFLL
jgi:Fe-S cluster assembly protein SufD